MDQDCVILDVLRSPAQHPVLIYSMPMDYDTDMVEHYVILHEWTCWIWVTWSA